MTNTQKPGSGKEPHKSERHRFEMAIRAVLQTGNPEFIALMSYIRRLLSQFHVASLYNPEEVFNIAYCRSIKSIDAGTIIEVPLAWMRRTSFNVIRELARTERKADSLDKECAPEPVYDDSVLADEILRDNIKVLRIALERLSEVDRKLLDLRYVHRFSWQEVGQCVAIARKGKQTEATLRQRGHRALNKLRKIYMEIETE